MRMHLHGSRQELNFKTHFSGDKVRILLTNAYNKNPLKVRNMSIMINGETYPVLVKGKTRFTMAPFSEFYSDEIEVKVELATAMVVTTNFAYFAKAYSASDFNSTRVSSSSHYGIFNRHMLLGLKTKAISKPHLQLVVLVKQVEVLSNQKSITWFGDSLTNHSYYTQVLQEKINERALHISIANAGHSGNRLLRDGEGMYKEAFGIAGIKRIDHDVFKYNKPNLVVVALGVNDLIHPGSNVTSDQFPKFEEMLEGYRYLLAKIKENNAKAAICTITPFEGYKVSTLDEAEEMRIALNDWIVNQKEFDLVIDIASIVEDKDRRSYLADKFESDDHLHWNQVGGDIIADNIDLDKILELVK